MTEVITLVALGMVMIGTLAALYISRPNTDNVVAQHLNAINTRTTRTTRTIHAPIVEAWSRVPRAHKDTSIPDTQAWRMSVDERIARMSGDVL